MRVSDKVELERTRLNFASTVVQRFVFLADFGFPAAEPLPMIVRYRKEYLEINVDLECRSFQVGIYIGHADEQYSMSEIIRATDPEAAELYRDPIAMTPVDLVSAVDRLAGLVIHYGERALRDDPAFFAYLYRQRRSLEEAYALDVLASQVRPKAEAAFREGKYREAAELYGQMTGRLTPVEIKKLDFARRRS